MHLASLAKTGYALPAELPASLNPTGAAPAEPAPAAVLLAEPVHVHFVEATPADAPPPVPEDAPPADAPPAVPDEAPPVESEEAPAVEQSLPQAQPAILRRSLSSAGVLVWRVLCKNVS